MAKRPGRIAKIGRAWKRFGRGLFDAIVSTATGGSWGYSVLDPRRKILPRTLALRSESANELATMSLPKLRSLCRKLERDNPTARAIVAGKTAQIVGTGIALEPDTGNPTIDARLRAVWQDYIQSCDISGQRSIYDLQTLAAREWFTTGEHLWRLVTLQERADQGMIALCVLALDSEWLMANPPERKPGAVTVVSGLELDQWGRPTGYRLVNPELHGSADYELVPAAQIIHGFECRRPLQNRGEPDMVPVIERLYQEGDLVDAELRAAVNCAAMAMVITSEYHDDPDPDASTDNDPATKIAIGSTTRLFPGEEAHAFSHDRPSQQIAPFRQMLRGDIAGAVGIDQRWLDRDYSRANYSSMRAAILDNERLLSPMREQFGHATIGALYKRVLPWLCLKAGISMPKVVNYRLVPEGQPYVNPKEDVEASIMAITSGLSTFEKEHAKRGDDSKKLVDQLRIERDDPLLDEIFEAHLYPTAKAQADIVETDSGATPSDGADNADNQPIAPAKKKGKA